MRKSLRALITLIVVAVAIACGLWLWHYYLYTPWTRDARIGAEIITIAPDVSGRVTELAVDDNVRVDAGQTLFRIDQARYQAAFDKASAIVAQREAELALREHEASRRAQLSRQAISAENQESANRNRDVAAATLDQARSDLASARLDLERTDVTAPAAGHVLNLQLAQGNYVTRGTAVMALVVEGSYYVTAYFEETKRPAFAVGDPATVILMSGDIELAGHVESIGRGIADDNTAPNNQLLPQVEPTFSWVRLAQRIPVRIALDELPEALELSAGMTATVRVQQESR
ncbi:efflux RND transporter periplasmic adaptor subunit [Halomonas cupida]|uniref:efflux RND transporter periplasmic adaptor subunit n=1 Tax=Halomonas cupida TaxID=44933 RepID=UPI003EF32AB8